MCSSVLYTSAPQKNLEKEIFVTLQRNIHEH